MDKRFVGQMPISQSVPFQGFNRIVISDMGEAVAPNRAIHDFHTRPAIGFMRKDGWSVGAPEELEYVAFRLWKDDYTHWIKFGETEWQPIETYKGHA